MRKLLSGAIMGLVMTSGALANNELAVDTSDPLFMLKTSNLLSHTTLTYWNHTVRLGENIAYGVSDRLSLGANLFYQENFNGHDDGFSAFDLGGVYRLATSAENNEHITSDVLFGLKVGGNSRVRTPYFADSTYYAGVRMGRQWDGLSVAGTIKSSWIFDETRGMAYIDFMPEAYFRIAPDWRAGANFMLRKATTPHYDQEWLGAKVVRQYGRTQYVGHIDYEFESDDVQIGTYVNVLF